KPIVLALTAAAIIWSLAAAPIATAERSHPGTPGSDGTAATSGRSAVSRQPADSLPGIDVSHYQHQIDWTQVAASGIRFAFAKASEGTGYVDPMYETNKIDAMAAGV